MSEKFRALCSYSKKTEAVEAVEKIAETINDMARTQYSEEAVSQRRGHEEFIYLTNARISDGENSDNLDYWCGRLSAIDGFSLHFGSPTEFAALTGGI